MEAHHSDILLTSTQSYVEKVIKSHLNQFSLSVCVVFGFAIILIASLFLLARKEAGVHLAGCFALRQSEELSSLPKR